MNKDTKISANKQKKGALIAEISEKVKKAQAVVVTNYQGMTHKQLEELKKALKKTDAELVITKNTLLNRSLEENKLETFKNMEGPTATLFAYQDVVAPLKELAKTIKNIKLPVIKMGLLDGKLIESAEVEKLSTLPTRDTLIAQFVGTLNSPITGLVRSLNWNIQKFAMTLKAIEAQKQATSA